MTSPLVAVGTNQCWSFAPCIDLIDADVCTGKSPCVAPSNALVTNADATPAASATATTSPPPPTLLRVDGSPSTLNILVAGLNDISHVVHTIARSRLHPSAPRLHFYVLDENIESLARSLVLLAVLFDRPLGRRGRMETFLDLYGNALIQERSHAHLVQHCKALIPYISRIEAQEEVAGDPSHLTPSLSFLAFTSLQLAHRSFTDLIDTLDFYATQPRPQPFQTAPKTQLVNAFDIEPLRDHRLRGFFGDRYDARANLVDWDYHMRLKTVASIVHIYHYKRWRLTGLAFEKRECEYKVPNRTLASYREAKQKGRGTVAVRGYWADTLVSPYITHGVICDVPAFYETRQDQHVKHAMDLSEYNVTRMLYELDTGRRYQVPPSSTSTASSTSSSSSASSSSSSATIEEIHEGDEESSATNERNKDQRDATTSNDSDGVVNTDPLLADLPNVHITFLHGTIASLATKQKYRWLFHRVVMSQFQVHHAEHLRELVVHAAAAASPAAAATPAATAAPSLSSSSTVHVGAQYQVQYPSAFLSIDTLQYFPMKDEEKQAFVRLVQEKIEPHGWRTILSSRTNSSWLSFSFSSSSSTSSTSSTSSSTSSS